MIYSTINHLFHRVWLMSLCSRFRGLSVCVSAAENKPIWMHAEEREEMSKVRASVRSRANMKSRCEIKQRKCVRRHTGKNSLLICLQSVSFTHKFNISQCK